MSTKNIIVNTSEPKPGILGRDCSIASDYF